MLPLGLHLNLPEEEHHADPGLGSTDLKSLLTDACQYQFKRLAEQREALGLGDSPDADKDSVGRAFGSAVHTMVLDGPEAFDARYVVTPERPADVLASIGEIREALGVRCALPKNAGLHDHEVMARLHGFKVASDWKIERLVMLEGKTEISRRWAATMTLIDRVLDAPRPQKGGMSIREAVLCDGVPEVTIVWDDDQGIRLKARFDWLRPGFVIDLKTYAAMDGREPIDSFVGSITRYAYHMQAAHYLDAYAQIAAAVAEGRVFGDVDPAWLKRLAAASQAGPPLWTWLAVQTVGMPHADDVLFDAPTVLLGGQGLVREAKQKYLANVERFGADRFWVSTRGTVVLEDVSFRPSINDIAAERWKII